MRCADCNSGVLDCILCCYSDPFLSVSQFNRGHIIIQKISYWRGAYNASSGVFLLPRLKNKKTPVVFLVIRSLWIKVPAKLINVTLCKCAIQTIKIRLKCPEMDIVKNKSSKCLKVTMFFLYDKFFFH